MPDPSSTLPFAPPDPSYDTKFAWIAFGLLLLAIIASSYLHHFQPQILRVPSNTDVSSWTSPSFDETTIYDRMTEQEKANILSEGVPLGDNVLAQFLIQELLTFLLGWICFRHARKHFGFWMASCFLIGSFVFTGLEESMWILLGRFGQFTPDSAVNAFGEPVCGTYWFTKGGPWFLETPVSVCIGWFFLAYSCVLIAGKVFPRMGLWGRATVGGLIAMGLDVWVDPVATSPESMNWVWAKGDVFLFFGIPHTNFVGWFLLIFLFAIFWEKLPLMEKRWGRTKATIVFYLIIFATEIGILVFFLAWIPALGGLLSLVGIKHGVEIPQGW